MMRKLIAAGICCSASLCFGAEWGVDNLKEKLDQEIEKRKNLDPLIDLFDHKEVEPGWEVFVGDNKTLERDLYAADDFAKVFTEEEKKTSPADLASIETHFFGSSHAPQESLLTPDEHAVKLPHFSRGINPVDYIGGGLDAAKSDRMEESLRRAARGAAYRHLVSLEATSPLTASVTKQIQSFANQLNAMGLHSYESAADLVAGLWPKADRSDAYLCQHVLLAEGDATDWITATYQCQDRNVRQRALQKASRSKQMIAGRSNAAAKILASLGFHPPAMDLLINLTGTVVKEDNDDIAIFPSRHHQVIALWQHGKTIDNAYLLQKDNISLERGPLMADTSEKARIFHALQSMQQKLRTDAPFSEAEKKLLDTPHFPVGLWLTLMTQYKGNGAQLALERMSEILAAQRVMQLAKEIVTNILHKAESLQFSQISGYELDVYIKQLDRVLQDLKDLQEEQGRNMARETESLQALTKIDETLRASEGGL